MLADVTLYSFSVAVHVVAAVIGFGSTFAESLTFPVAMATDRRHLPYVHRLGLAINQRFAGPGLGIVVLTGIFQVLRGNWSFKTPWIAGGVAIAIVLGGLIGSYFIPEDRALAELVARDIAASGDGPVTLSDEYQARSKRLGMVGALAGLLVVVAVFLMVTKPGS